MNLTTACPQNCFSNIKSLVPFGQGLGSFGLPGDYSPASRFVKAEILSVAQLFHIQDSVNLIRGSVVTKQEHYDTTTYACCMNATKGRYYYKTYANSQLTAVDLLHENLDAQALKTYPLVTEPQIS